MRTSQVAATTAAFVVFLTLGPAAGAAVGGPTHRWTRHAGVELRDVAVRGTDSFVTGVRRVKGLEQLLVRRYGGAGRVVWTRTWRPAALADQTEPWAAGHTIAAAADGGVYVGGLATHGCREDGGMWFVRKYGPKGRLLWHREGPRLERCRWRPGTAIDDLAVRGTTLAAAANECGGDYCDGRVEVFSTRGVHARTISFEPRGAPSASMDRVRGIDITAGGAIVAAGWVAMDTGFDPAPDIEATVVALRPTGQVLWSRILSDEGEGDFDAAGSVAARRHQVVVAGVEGRAGCRGPWPCPMVVGISTAGRLLWRWRGGAQVDWDGGSVDIAHGPRIIAGWTRRRSGDVGDERLVLLRLRSDGTRRWIARLDDGTLTSLAAIQDRVSVAGYDLKGGAVWRYAF